MLVKQAEGVERYWQSPGQVSACIKKQLLSSFSVLGSPGDLSWEQEISSRQMSETL